MRNNLATLPVFAAALGLTPWLLPGWTSTAHAGEITRVASAFEEDNPFDLHLGVDYGFRFKSAAILREWGRQSNTRFAKDLIYRQFRHTITPSLEIGLFRGLSAYLTIPVILSDDRNYRFDQSSPSGCVYPDEVGSSSSNADQATCVDKTNSTTLRDGIIPLNGYNAKSSGSPFGAYPSDTTDTIFTSPTRRGIDQLHVGLKYAVVDQKRKSFAPTWVVGLEGRFGVGRAMSLEKDPSADPVGNHAVGRKIHELGVWTAISRRHRFFEPYFFGYWRYATRANGSKFEKFDNPAQDRYQPQSQTGAQMGVEIVPWVQPSRGLKFAININGSADLNYGGRAYSEVWELLADSPALVGTDSPGRSQCNARAAVEYATQNPSDPSGYLRAANEAEESGDCRSFSGITTVQDFGSFGLNLSFNFHLGPMARLSIGARVDTNTRHFVTSESRGDPTLSGPDDTVETDSIDVNPLRRDVIDNAGRRYAVDDVVDLNGFAKLIVTF